MIANVLSIDVEEYYHAAIFRRGVRTLASRTFESRVEGAIDRLLALMDAHGARGTFFVLGEVAAQQPAMIRRIDAAGHEIACHGQRHEDVSRQSPRRFRADVRQAKAQIEDIVARPVVGYRAPNFSIGPNEQAWAFPILLDEGFTYDSSVYPIRHDRYGQPDAPRFPHEVWRDGSRRLLEFPIGTTRLCGMNLPIGGGGFFRLLPLSLFTGGIRRVNGGEQQPVMFYLHPWELDADQPRPPMAWRNRFRHYIGLARTPRKLAGLLGQTRFAPAREVLAAHPADRPNAAPPVNGSRVREATTIHVSQVAPEDTSWHVALDALPAATLAHAPEWIDVINQSYQHESLYLVAEDATGEGVLPAFVVRRPFAGPVVASMPFLDGGGPCASSPALTHALVTALVERARRLGARHVELRCAAPLDVGVQAADHKVNLTLALSSPAITWNALGSTVRNQVRKGEKSGLRVEFGAADALEQFYPVFAARMHELGSPVHGRTFFDAVLRVFGTRARVALVRTDTETIGGLLAITWRDTMVVPWAACLTQYRALCPNMLLYWETIRAAAAEGLGRFDFGRSTRGSGTYKFKRQWGAQEAPLLFYSIPVSATTSPRGAGRHDAAAPAHLLTGSWRRLPPGLTTRLGPHIRRYLIQ